MTKLLLDQYAGITEYLVDNHDGTFSLESHSDIEDTIEHNKAIKNHNDGYSPSREWRRIAEFPRAMIPILTKMYGADPFAKGNEDLLKRVLNDPDLAHFRNSYGRV